MGINTARRLLWSASCLLAVLATLAAGDKPEARRAGVGFAAVSGTRFMVDGRPFYSHGFNAHWLMYMGSDPADRSKVIDTLDQASRLGATLVRTWAFSDGGGSRPLQITPGVYNEDTFKVLLFLEFHGFFALLRTIACYTLLDSIVIASTNCVPTDSQNFLKYVLEFLKT
jgi:mannan endo-1,4-beta-mannosidase